MADYSVIQVHTNPYQAIYQGSSNVIRRLCITENKNRSHPIKQDITFEKFLRANHAKTLSDYFSNHWDRIMGIHYEYEAHAVLEKAFFNTPITTYSPEVQDTFKGGLDYLIFPLVARKLYMDVIKDFIDFDKTHNLKYDRPVINSLKLLAWVVLELMRHIIGFLVMTAVVISSPLLLCINHDQVTNDYLNLKMARNGIYSKKKVA